MRTRNIDVFDLEINYYGVLEVPTNASHEQIKKARNKKGMNPSCVMRNELLIMRAALAYQTDKNDGQDKMRALNEAFEVLGNRKLREEYDEKMRFPPPPDNGNMAGESKNEGPGKSNHQFTPKDPAGMEELWPRPPPPKTDGLGTSRCDRLGDGIGTFGDDAAAVDREYEAIVEELEAEAKAYKEFVKKNGIDNANHVAWNPDDDGWL
jgi:curved DNA-binding protein CbpA